MLGVAAAVLCLVATVGLFRLAMPSRTGKKRWFIGTGWEPYVAISFVFAIALSVGLLALSIGDLLSRWF
jgi:hypothetical protein